jgi:hypothetical protein
MSSDSGDAAGFGVFDSVADVGSWAPSAVLIILTSPVAGVSAVASAGAIGGFVITGLATAGFVARLERRYLRVCASASTKQKLTTRHVAMRNLM